jgi:hypothetical protein
VFRVVLQWQLHRPQSAPLALDGWQPQNPGAFLGSWLVSDR